MWHLSMGSKVNCSSRTVAFVLVSIVSVTLLFIAWVMYRLALPHIIARMGS